MTELTLDPIDEKTNIGSSAQLERERYAQNPQQKMNRQKMPKSQ